MDPKTKFTAKDCKISKPSKLWLIVEYEIQGGKKDFCVIEPKDIIGPIGDSMDTGKQIVIRHGRHQISATVFIISDDKIFVDTEVIRLQASVCKEQENGIDINRPFDYSQKVQMMKAMENGQKKRRRSGDSLSNQSIISKVANGINGRSVDYVPPMTFDQQTQTDTKLLPPIIQDKHQINPELIDKILSNQECMLACESTRSKQMLELSQQNQCLKEMMSKLWNYIQSNRDENKLAKLEPESISNKIIQNSQPQVYRITNIPNSHDLSGNETTIIETINEIEVPHCEETIIDYNDSSISAENNSNSLISTSYCPSTVSESKIHNLSIKSIGGRRSANTNFTNESLPKPTIVQRIQQDWEYDENEYISIGPNTTIPKESLNKVKWSSHTHATRTLLTSVFSREVLATHSLTGRPSPAFMDSQKPEKKQLDTNRISDIVHYVSQRCGVSESAVRSAITTKCADENKMWRTRKARENNRTLDSYSNKENQINGGRDSRLTM